MKRLILAACALPLCAAFAQTPPGIKHWHGAAPSTAKIHIAIQDTVDGRNVEWMEKVSDEQYGK